MSMILIVGGTWDNAYGKPSKIIGQINKAISSDKDITDNYTITCLNGGGYRDLYEDVVFNDHKDLVSIILWAVDIPNELDKMDVKGWYPRSIVITTKRNTENKYSFQDIVAHGLSKKSNLMIEIQKENERYAGRLLDPLGNQWFPTDSSLTDDFGALAIHSIRRAIQLSKITRQATVQSPEKTDPIPYDKEFLEVVKRSANTFHELIEPGEHIERFLGNASFRCTRGFPSMRTPDGRIYVSRRNIDKRHIDIDAFVQVGLNRIGGDSDKSILWYRGEHKPSVDTPIQLRLYERFKNINYMIHSHVYVEDAPFTDRMIPCGGVEEAWYISKLAYKEHLINSECCAINLIGHGSIVFMSKPADIEYFKFKKRPMPEIQNETTRYN